MKTGPFLLLPFLCAASASAQDSLDLDRARVVDLSYAFDARTLYWPNAPAGFKLERLAYGPTPGGFFYSANAYSAPEHGGTHLDAPIHFAEGRRAADEVPLDQLIGRAFVIDVAAKAEASPDYTLSRDDVAAFEARHGAIPKGAIVLLRTGWGSRWPDRKRYLGDDRPGETSNLHFPSFGRDAAQLLVQTRQVGVLGVDTASIDHGPSRDFIVHQIAAAANVPALENVANLQELPPTGAWIIALPMKIAGGSGGPVRIVALLPR
jgi:kynurenine formamidase